MWLTKLIHSKLIHSSSDVSYLKKEKADQALATGKNPKVKVLPLVLTIRFLILMALASATGWVAVTLTNPKIFDLLQDNLTVQEKEGKDLQRQYSNIIETNAALKVQIEELEDQKQTMLSNASNANVQELRELRAEVKRLRTLYAEKEAYARRLEKDLKAQVEKLKILMPDR